MQARKYQHLCGLLLLAVLVFCLPLATHARPRIGVIMTGNVEYYGAMHEAFVAELGKRMLGTSQPEIILQRPFPDAIAWSNAARKLIAIDVDLIVTYGSPATHAVLHEKSKIPVVYAGVYDPEKALVSGKNVTGCGFKVPLSSLLRYFKRLKKIDSLSVVFSSLEEDTVRQKNELLVLTKQQGINVIQVDIRRRSDVNRLQDIKDDDAVFITGSALAHLWINDIVSILRKEGDLTADIFPDSSEAGVLITLYPPPEAQGKEAAAMAASILHGVQPQDIKAEIFRETELVFNLIEAKRMGIIFPVQLIVDATKVIK